MTKYIENPPTFTCTQWTGTNFDEFKKIWPVATHFNDILVIPLWSNRDKRWIDHSLYVNDWAVSNDLSDEFEVVDHNRFLRRFEEA